MKYNKQINMGLFEIIGERRNPGPIGKIDFSDKYNSIQKKHITIRFIFSLIIIGIIEYLLIYETGWRNKMTNLLISNIVLLIYLVISLFINIRPNFNNTGMRSFLFDNPFRYSDDINRYLILLKVIFEPGKFISKSIVGYIISLKA
jgi:hypothetical protein